MLREAIVLALWASACATAQPVDRQVAFEVASIKPSLPTATITSWKGGPGDSDPGRVTIQNYMLQAIIAGAYEVRFDQVAGSDRLDARFDISAKVPAGAIKEQVPLMMQNLLAERFHLEIHREKKESTVYDLIVAKNGPKLKESPKDPAPPTYAPDSSSAPLKLSRDGYPVLPRGYSMAVVNDHAVAQFPDATMAQLADLLTAQLGRPVTNATRLTGKYEFSLRWVPEGYSKPDDPQPTLSDAVQQLGLKLQQKQGFVDMIVIDHIDKVPTEN
jgi:uncharacterized protein (TIGR03435 family)